MISTPSTLVDVPEPGSAEELGRFAALQAKLGPLAESNFMTTMVSFDNDWTVFFTRPISGAVLALSLLGLVYPMVRAAVRAIRHARTQHATPARC